MNNFLIQSLAESQATLNKFIENRETIINLSKAVDVLTTCLESGGKIMSCGNGGSMCDAMHFTEELTGRYRKDRKPLAAFSLTEPAHMSCVANDYGYDYIFSRYIEALGKSGDVLFAISTSGNSKNVLLAVEYAKKQNLKVIALTGKDGGKLHKLADVSFLVESFTTDRIQEIHIKIIHLLIEGIERKLFPENYSA
jgi:D-sedoheptulose 7-phosphate isomerase